jgi:uncharacterized small protein (DUF1192 family)
MDKRARIAELEAELTRLDRTMVAHNETPGHPDFCSPASITLIFPGDCLMGSSESILNMTLHATPNLSSEKILEGLERAVPWVKYGLMVEELNRLRAELERENAPGSK